MTKDGAERPAREARPSRARSLPLAVGALMLVAVAGAAAHGGIRLSDRGPLADQRAPLIVIGGLLLIVDILVIALIRRMLRGRRRPGLDKPTFGDEDVEPEPWWARLLSYVIVFILIALPLLLIYYGLRRHGAESDEQAEQQPAAVPNVELPESTISDAALSVMVLVSLALIVAAAVVSYRQLRNRAPRPAFDPGLAEDANVEPAEDERTLASAVHAGEMAIKNDGDPREAIIACYAAMEATLAEQGSPRRPTDTPSELLDRAADSGLVRSDASRILTEIFRQARFSRHRMGERDVEAAVSALRRLRADLGVRT